MVDFCKTRQPPGITVSGCFRRRSQPFARSYALPTAEMAESRDEYDTAGCSDWDVRSLVGNGWSWRLIGRTIHITNGNQKEERLVNVMGGTVLETQSEKWIRQGLSQGIFLGEVKMLIELGQEYGK